MLKGSDKKDKTVETFLTDKEISDIAMTKKSPTATSSSSLLLSALTSKNSPTHPAAITPSHTPSTAKTNALKNIISNKTSPTRNTGVDHNNSDFNSIENNGSQNSYPTNRTSLVPGIIHMQNLGKSNKEEKKAKTPQQEQQQAYHEHLEIIQKAQQVPPQPQPQQNKLLQMLKKPQTTETATEIQDKSRPQSEQVQQLHQQQHQLLKILQPHQQATQQRVSPPSAPSNTPEPSGHPPSISQPSTTSSERRVVLSELFKSQSLIDKNCDSSEPMHVSPNMTVTPDTVTAKKSTTVNVHIESSSKSCPKSSTPTSVATTPFSTLKPDQNTPIVILQRKEASRHHQSKAIPIPVHATPSPALYPASPKLSPTENEKSVETREALFAIMRAKAASPVTASPVKFNAPFSPPSISSSVSDHIDSREKLIVTPKVAPLVSPTPIILPTAVPTKVPANSTSSSLNVERSPLTHTHSDNALQSLLSGMSSSTKGTASEKARESQSMPILPSYPSEDVTKGATVSSTPPAVPSSKFLSPSDLTGYIRRFKG
eukprot:CAMPEP_0119052086 /NCGR_PEP_ID=MMETSP1177-20130426/73501_1 /TAXON_ID=2985 /ORGANISM="Ochromonas sp, Strain CCMP1899" /LENGTH=541 /DNA_ID=CAMNT_0007031537 /DNA_START=472 /DNA_END=2097 /DNA_ORIENTATION=-